MNAAVRSLIRQDRDSGDLWGWSMSHRFAIAETLSQLGESVPSAWEFRRGAASRDADEAPEEYPDCDWYEALTSGEVDADDARHAGDVLQRYTDLLRRAGRDY